MMATTQVSDEPTYSQITVHGVQGTTYHQVRNSEPRPCRKDEVPIIDLGGIDGGSESRHALAKEVKTAAESIGFFYISNHGIGDEVIKAAANQAKAFFHQPTSTKELVAKKKSNFYNGWHAQGSTRTSATESVDRKESFMWRYDPAFDPDKSPGESIPDAVQQYMKHESFLWDGTEHLAGFQQALVKYWQECLSLSRKMVKIFALALDLPEDYFDNLTTYPGR